MLIIVGQHPWHLPFSIFPEVLARAIYLSAYRFTRTSMKRSWFSLPACVTQWVIVPASSHLIHPLCPFLITSPTVEAVSFQRLPVISFILALLRGLHASWLQLFIRTLNFHRLKPKEDRTFVFCVVLIATTYFH